MKSRSFFLICSYVREICLPEPGEETILAVMKRTAAILLWICPAALCPAGDAFYVWQQQWSSRVVAAVTNEPATDIYFLATVVPAKGESTLVEVPWAALEASGHRFVPVIRVPLNAFGRDDELLRIADKLKRFDEIQIDLDCPESRLMEYAGMLTRLRPQLPQEKLSITALPAHLGNPAFSEVAAAVDEYTLQVHGLEVPKQISDSAELMNHRVALRAIGRADTLGRSCRVALPCYAYELNFDPETGRFLYLTAERPARRGDTQKRRIAASPADLIELQQHSPRVIWFRLPVEGDRLCLPRAALSEIQSGRAPADGIGIDVTRVSDTTLELTLSNTNVIHAVEAEMSLEWNAPRGAFDLYDGSACPDCVPGQLPTRLTTAIPPPGQSVRIGWFSSAEIPTLKVTFR